MSLTVEVEKLVFDRNKYNKELLIDCPLYSEQPVKLIDHPFILDFYGIFLITCGTGQITVDEELLAFKKGSLLFFQPRQIRQWHNISDSFDGYFLVFESEFIETFFQDAYFIYRFQFFNPNLPAILNCSADIFSKLIDRCKQIRIELQNILTDSHHLFRSLLYSSLIEINRAYSNSYNLTADIYQDNKSMQFHKLLNENIRKFQKVEDYAKLMKISRSQLNNILKESTGKPASVHIKERLLTEIKRELLYTNLSIKEICFGLNFSDVSNFIRFFKNATTLNPNQYRQSNTK